LGTKTFTRAKASGNQTGVVVHLRFFQANEIRDLLSPALATKAIRRALLCGLDPSNGPARSAVHVNNGHFLLMPAERKEHTGIKVATVAPENPSLQLPRIQALYLLFDAQTLTPKAVLDGTELTAIRTPAVSVAAILPVLERRTGPLRIAVFGAGRQGVGHVETLAEVVQGRHGIEKVSYIVRNPLACLASKPVGASLAPTLNAEVLSAGSKAAEAAVATADVVICATSATEPLFDSRILRPDAIVVAVGSHEPRVREIDSAFCTRAQVVVEDVDTALRESGDVIMAIAETDMTAESLISMRDVVTGVVTLDHQLPVLFKSSGMSWEDLVIAEAVLEAECVRSA
jgi:ornithine cyclodeaminase/alanine dehydrogenase-like protein (mu-crystallin family)